MYFITEKISERKEQDGDTGPKSNSAIEDFCDRFDRAVKNTASSQVNHANKTSMSHKSTELLGRWSCLFMRTFL